MNATNQNVLHFGMTGVIVGILDTVYEVVFDHPFIGGTNLNGKCKNLRGGIINFTDVYNLEAWCDILKKRISYSEN